MRRGMSHEHGRIVLRSAEARPAGTFHSVSEQHLQRYATEFDFRWNTRQSLGFNDTQRAAVALKNIGGKRLTYRRIDA